MMAVLRRAAAVVQRELDADVILLLTALLLIATGFWNWWRPGAYVVPGLVLLWLTLPARLPFVASGTTAPRHGVERPTDVESRRARSASAQTG
jgi:hypothetical protein